VVLFVNSVVLYGKNSVCKNHHHHQVVDTVHLNHVGQYQQLAVEGDSGVEMQPVNTAQIPATLQSPAGSST
jgi:hypothetical protein